MVSEAQQHCSARGLSCGEGGGVRGRAAACGGGAARHCQSPGGSQQAAGGTLKAVAGIGCVGLGWRGRRTTRCSVDLWVLSHPVASLAHPSLLKGCVGVLPLTHVLCMHV